MTVNINNYDAYADPWAQAAYERVMEDPDLTEYYDLLVEYSWDNQNEHNQWVAEAEVEEILSWAKDIRYGQVVEAKDRAEYEAATHAAIGYEDEE